MYKFDWRNLVLVIVLGIVSVMAFFTLIDWTIEKDNIVGIGNIVTFLGSILGGTITLVGVYITIKHSEKTEQLKQTPHKLEQAEKLILSLKIAQNHLIEELYGGYNVSGMLYRAKDVMEKRKILLNSIQVSSKSYYSVKNLESNLNKYIRISNEMKYRNKQEIDGYTLEKMYQNTFREFEECITVIHSEVEKINNFFFN
ncbi:hypothetical protein [Lysinibacillus capsici]|uniref:hypothetical protein n=1 Tax=Lysinibacillus capsici TaxID=2115968 RepID=UPI002896724A|nr:hypothetical protein [Lysinibacillus capsici]